MPNSRLTFALTAVLALTGALADPVRLSADERGEQLLSATRKGDLGAVKRLLDEGADVNTKTRYASTPLFFACDRGHLEIARLLIDRGADLNVKDNFYNASALGLAITKKHDDVAALLIEKGADPAEALRGSIEDGDRNLFQLILDKGKLTRAILDDALLVATASKNEKNDGMAKILEDKGARPVNYPVDEATLRGYEGRYVEGDTNMTFAIKDGKLSFVAPQASTALIPFARDRFKFVQAGIEFTFERDDQGNVVSVRFASRGGDL
jgi:ankyrin repeat protein